MARFTSKFGSFRRLPGIGRDPAPHPAWQARPRGRANRCRASRTRNVPKQPPSASVPLPLAVGPSMAITGSVTVTTPPAAGLPERRDPAMRSKKSGQVFDTQPGSSSSIPLPATPNTASDMATRWSSCVGRRAKPGLAGAMRSPVAAFLHRHAQHRQRGGHGPTAGLTHAGGCAPRL